MLPRRVIVHGRADPSPRADLGTFMGSSRLARRGQAVLGLVLALLLALPTAAAAEPAPEEWTASISGTVVTADGAPVEGGTVAVFSPGDAPYAGRASTDALGRYRIDGLHSGAYTVHFTPRWRVDLPQWWTGLPGGAVDQQDAVALTLGTGQQVQGIDAALARGGSISGEIAKSDGTPADYPWAAAYRQVVRDGHLVWSREATSTERPYLLDGLPPGDYALVFGTTDTSSSTPSVYEFWEDATTLSGARLHTVVSSESTRIDARLSSGATLSGEVSSPSGAHASSGYVVLERQWRSGDEPTDNELRNRYGSRGDSVDGAGRFEITGIPAGTYRLYARSGSASAWWPDSPSSAGGRTITVTHGAVIEGYEVSIASTMLAGTGTVTGTLRAGSVVSALPEKWPAAATLSYQWMADEEPIAGANDSSLRLSNAQAGRQISVAVTATRTDYYPVTAVLHPEVDLPVVGVIPAPDPRVSGTPVVGRMLTAIRGKDIPGVSYRYQWLANGTAIRGATEKYFLTTPAQAGKRISVRVAWQASGMATVVKKSATTAPLLRDLVARAVLIEGNAAVGHRLSLRRSSWGAGVAYTYRWYADGAPIRGATGTTFTPTKAQVGKRITATMTGRKPGYTTKTVTAPATRRVLARLRV